MNVFKKGLFHLMFFGSLAIIPVSALTAADYNNSNAQTQPAVAQAQPVNWGHGGNWGHGNWGRGDNFSLYISPGYNYGYNPYYYGGYNYYNYYPYYYNTYPYYNNGYNYY